MKLRRALHEVHLIALKADFELFLNRVLTVVWTAHFDSLAGKASNKRVRELALAAVQGNAGHDFVIQMVVPEYGLPALVGTLKEATHIELPKDLPAYDFSQWSQIQVAFAVRHLIEHRDGKVDTRFRENVQKFWDNSSWGKRGRLPDTLEKITVEEADVVHTYDAMCRGLACSPMPWCSGTRNSSNRRMRKAVSLRKAASRPNLRCSRRAAGQPTDTRCRRKAC